MPRKRDRVDEKGYLTKGEPTAQDLAKAIASFKTAVHDFERQQKAFYQNLATRIDEGLLTVQKIMRKHEDVLKEAQETNKTIESTLIHVLIAIRQNEYLQAWTPKAQEELNGAY